MDICDKNIYDNITDYKTTLQYNNRVCVCVYVYM